MRGATRDRKQQGAQGHVSIHAPHARGDQMVTLLSTTAICFNPRPSCEGRLIPKTIANQIIKFQSTPLMRGATRVTSPPAGTDGFQSTPLMRGATDGRLVEPHALVVSIHAPHARGDLTQASIIIALIGFNPRPSCEGRRPHKRQLHGRACFNPRPSCEGRRCAGSECSRCSGFNPRPSCEGRLNPLDSAGCANKFQSTPLMRGATQAPPSLPCSTQFQSTPLMRGATWMRAPRGQGQPVSIHAPHARGDADAAQRHQ